MFEFHIDFMLMFQKLTDFDAAKSYKKRSLDELNGLASELNGYKGKLSKSISWYLRNAGKLGLEYDIPRLCRALAAPDMIASKFLGENEMPKQTDYVRTKKFMEKVLLGTLPNGYYENLGNPRKSAIATDMAELGVYMKMYLDVELAVGYLPEKFPNGNPFNHMMDIMGTGAVIARFKYVSRNSSKPREKVVSCHLLNSIAGPEMVVHVEGDRRFSMYKMWGQGDDEMAPLEKRYRATVIRWAKNDVRRRLEGLEVESGGPDRFLY
jgi:hypothetical protein